MAMQRTLWSVNALAVEVNKDRRTVAKALDGIPPDGFVSGNRAWFLSTALRALGLGDPPPAAGRGIGGGVMVGNIRDRLASWKAIHAEEPPALPISAVAEIMRVSVATVLLWLRAGCPYRTVGSWKSGDGFMLNLAWLIEWRAAIGDMVEHADADLARQLGFTV